MSGVSLGSSFPPFGGGGGGFCACSDEARESAEEIPRPEFWNEGSSRPFSLYGRGSKPMGSHFGIGAPPILVHFSGVGMFFHARRELEV